MGSVVKAVSGVLLLACVVPTSSEGQTRGPDDAAVQAYYRTIGQAFSVSLEEVRILGEWKLTPEEIPVVLFVARRAGVSPDAIATQREAGTAWTTVAQRYGVGADVFHISFPSDTNLGPLEDTYRRFAETPRAGWATLLVDDGVLVALVNIRVLANQLGEPPARVLATWERAQNLVLVHKALTSN